MIPKPPEHVATITESANLGAFIARLRQSDWIAVDTEFLRERTYYPKLCLVQIADRDEVGLIDVLAIDDLEPLAALLADPGVLKVFHSAEQDLEVLCQRFGQVPAPLFDTQIAAALIGMDDQMGYARLIAALLDVDLPKGHTRTDWSQRPLPAGALEYAADDVRYLAVAYALIREQLAERQRDDWLDEDFQTLADPERFRIDPADTWQRLKNWHRLDPAQQQVLAELAAWRERTAMNADRPRKWILGDDALMDIARQRPGDTAALAAIRSLPDKTATRHGDALLASVTTAMQRPAQPLAETPQPPSAAEKACIRDAMAYLNARAEAEDIAAAALASRKEIAAIVNGARDTRVLRGWRAQVAGNEMLTTIENTDGAKMSNAD